MVCLFVHTRARREPARRRRPRQWPFFLSVGAGTAELAAERAQGLALTPLVEHRRGGGDDGPPRVAGRCVVDYRPAFLEPQPSLVPIPIPVERGPPGMPGGGGGGVPPY